VKKVTCLVPVLQVVEVEDLVLEAEVCISILLYSECMSFYLLPLYCLLLLMLFHHMLDRCQNEIKARVDSLFRKAFRRGFCFQTLSMLTSAADKKLIRQSTSNRHCLHFTPSQTKTYQSTKFSQKPWTQLSVTTN